MIDISGYNCRQTILQSMVYLLISKQLQKTPLLFVAKSVVSEFPIKLVQWTRKSQVNIILVQVWPKFNVGPSHSFISSSGLGGTEPKAKNIWWHPQEFTGEITRLQHFSWWVFRFIWSNPVVKLWGKQYHPHAALKVFWSIRWWCHLSFVLLMFNPYGVTLDIYVYWIPKP